MKKNDTEMSKNMFSPSRCLSNIELLNYANDALSQSKRHKIEQHLNVCPLCSEAMDGIEKRNTTEDTQTIINQIKKDLNAKISEKKNNSWQKYIYSIAAALMIFAVLFFVNKNGTQDPQKIFTAYFEAYPNTVPILRGEMEATDLQLAMIEYDRENYQVALAIFEKILKSDKDQIEATFYSGVACLYLKQSKKALEFLKNSQEIADGKFKNAIHWYLGLAYILNKNYHLAKEQFSLLVKSENKFKQKSLELLSKLELK